jgi:hypothetical protein
VSDRNYYVIKEARSGGAGREWKVKLERGPVLSTHGQDRPEAIAEAKRLGASNGRGVMVNYADGRTGAAYHSEGDLA